MRLVSYLDGFGRVEHDHIVPMGHSLLAFLRDGVARDGEPVPLSDVRLTAPLPAPGKIICIGLNYVDHANEGGVTVPDSPILFAKYANSVIGAGDAIVVPAATDQPDYEAELGVVIGATAHAVAVEDALGHVAGYMCCNDVSARDLQFESSQWTLGKAIDTFLPCGPFLVTRDEVPDPQDLRIRCTVAGEVLQDASTRDMVFSVAELIAFISRTITLEPGDLIATGTPAGVGSGRTPPRWLRAGEEVSVEIEGLGTLTNPVRRPRS